MAFLSVSMDLAGSTLAKQSIISLAGGDEEKRAELYREYLNILFSIERVFYIHLYENLRAASLDMDRIFLIKSIGDEFWYAIKVDEHDDDDLVNVAMAVIDACSQCISAERYLPIYSSGQTEVDARFENTSFPIKVLIDLILEPIEITAMRYEYLKDIIPSMADAASIIMPSDGRIKRLYSLLNLAHNDGESADSTKAIRQDYIGFEIDRFFRLAKTVKPSILTMGDTLFSRLPVTLKTVHSGDFQMGIRRAAMGEGTSHGPLRCWYIGENFPATTLKGIDENYVLHHFFKAEDFEEPSMGMTQAALTLLASSFAFLAEHGYFLIDRAEY